MLNYGGEDTAATTMIAALKIDNGDSAYGGSSKSLNKRFCPSSPRSPAELVIKRIKTRSSEARKLLEVNRDLSTLEVLIRRLMRVNWYSKLLYSRSMAR